MRRIILLVSMSVFLLVMTVSVSAAPVFFGIGSEKIIKVADFPNTEEYKLANGQYVDAGYVYKQAHIFFIPVWNYDGRWAGYAGSEKVYLPLTKAELDEIAKEANVKLPDTPTLSFWETVGGKLVFGLILLLYIGWKLLNSQIENQGEDTDGGTFENAGILSIK